MTQSRFTQTPTRAIIITEFAVGLLSIVFAVLNATSIDGTTDGLLAVGLGIVGGLAVGLAMGMSRHLLSTRTAVDQPA
ncbi:hypothetical protein [Nocardioides sp. URHA0020]|uniref:hypothetical protein n=1 Tax=Nocardioides sp. URHA0020 TaxID=1380392 RepID=UPI00048EA295|nr:hypothetical protein [Nocardioides sp. URHA0020]